MMCAILITRLLHAIFGEAGFELHKWHCNEQTLESEANSEQEDEKQIHAKEQEEGTMGHKMNHFNVGKGHPIEEVKIILVLYPHLPPTKSEPLSDHPLPLLLKNDRVRFY